MNNKIKVNYNNRRISLDYSCIEEESLINSNLKEVKASGQGNDYRKAEQEAQLYLIKNALSKSTKFHKLEKIVGITQNVHLLDEGKIKIILEGYGVFN